VREWNIFEKDGVRKIYSYSGLGYAVAGVVIEALSKKSYAQVVADRVLKPLKMERGKSCLQTSQLRICER